MELCIKNFDELSNTELYNIIKLRCEVFVVEQNCIYNDLDGLDFKSTHVFYKDGEEVVACLRIIPLDGTKVRIGRVVSKEKRTGLGTELLKNAIICAKQNLGASGIIINAQSYIKSFYAKQGFVQTSGEFMEDGIAHVRMELDI